MQQRVPQYACGTLKSAQLLLTVVVEELLTWFLLYYVPNHQALLCRECAWTRIMEPTWKLSRQEFEQTFEVWTSISFQDCKKNSFIQSCYVATFVEEQILKNLTSKMKIWSKFEKRLQVNWNFNNWSVSFISSMWGMFQNAPCQSQKATIYKLEQQTYERTLRRWTQSSRWEALVASNELAEWNLLFKFLLFSSTNAET